MEEHNVAFSFDIAVLSCIVCEKIKKTEMISLVVAGGHCFEVVQNLPLARKRVIIFHLGFAKKYLSKETKDDL